MTEPNIVQFPRDKIVREAIPDIEELNKVKEKSIMNFADSVVEDMSSNVLFELGNYGIDIESEAFMKDFHFLVAVFAATIYRTLSVDHPLHSFMDKNVVVAKFDDEMLNDENNLIIGQLLKEAEDLALDNPD
jgi:hypothetical protein